MICWTDIETSGLDKNKCSILEVAAVMTDDDLNEIGEPFSSVVMPLPGRGIEVMDDVVVEMHEKSGLLAEIYELSWKNRGLKLRDGLLRTDEVCFELHVWLTKVTNGSSMTDAEYQKLLRETPLAGSSVHFDRKFMEERGFELFASRFSHRHLDVSALNEAAKRWAPTRWRARPGADAEGKPIAIAHRALPDIRASIEVARHYRDLFRGSEPLKNILSPTYPLGEEVRGGTYP